MRHASWPRCIACSAWLPGFVRNICVTPSGGHGRQVPYLLRVILFDLGDDSIFEDPLYILAAPARNNHMSNTNMKRNYKQEYNKYYGRGPACDCTPTQRKYRMHKALRARARRKVKSKQNIPRNHDVDHSNGNPLDNRSSNLKVIPRSINRGKNKK